MCDIINKASNRSRHGGSVPYVMSLPFLVFVDKEEINIAMPK